jgi:hypothetical protein
MPRCRLRRRSVMSPDDEGFDPTREPLAYVEHEVQDDE